jgi:hypothetical protein
MRMRATHAPLVAQMPGLRRLVINQIQADPRGAPAAWYGSMEDMRAALGSAQGSGGAC